MKRVVLGLLIVISIFVVISCASSEPVQQQVQSQPVAPQVVYVPTKESEPVYTPPVDKWGNPAPEWVRTMTLISEDMNYFVAVAEDKTGKLKTANLLNDAETDCLNQLVQSLGAAVKRVKKSYEDIGGVDNDVQIIDRVVDATIIRIKQNPVGFARFESWIPKDGNEVYLCCQYPKGQIGKELKETYNDFKRNESAAYADFRSESVWDEIDSEF